MSFKISDKVTWVGKIDWQLRYFHGHEYSTHRGSSYNSYLIKDKKTVLLDTAWIPYDKEFVANLKKEIDLNEIDYIVSNHAEIDHSGSLPELMREIPNTPIYCTKNGVNVIKGHYHQDWNFVEVKTGDSLDLGENKLIFVEARMLHWPDTMFSYLTGEEILFSTDAFGQHFASELMYNDLVDQCELYQEAIKYYANILTPFSALVERKIDEVLKLELPVRMICPSHGVIWRDNPGQIIEKYLDWSRDYQENQISIIYDTMWESTKKMAEAIGKGIVEKDPDTRVKIFSLSLTDINDVLTEVFKSKAVLLGSPTINKGILSAAAAILELMAGMNFKKKKGAAFGSYGWSGESPKILSERLANAGFEIVTGPLKTSWVPDENAMENCKEFGRIFAEKVRQD